MKKILCGLVPFNAFLIAALFGRHFYTPDTPCYVAGARLLFGLPGGRDCDFRILKPLALIVPGLLERATGIEAQYGFLIQNLLFYFLASTLIFQLIGMVFRDELKAFWATVMFITAPPLMLYGLAYMTDMPAWFFGILGIYVTLRVYSKLTEKPEYAIFIGFIMGFGFLWKESAVTGAVFFGAYVLLSNLPGKVKAGLCVYGVVGFAIPVLISSGLVYNRFHYTFWGWYAFIQTKPYGNSYTLSEFIREVTRTFDVVWLLFVAGVFRFLRDFFQRNTDASEVRFLIASGATILLWPIWPYPSNRLFYLSCPFLVSVGANAVELFGKERWTFLVLLAVFLNLVIVALWSALGLRGLVYILGIAYSAIMIWCLRSIAGSQQASKCG